jgi:hypothetical protein
MKLPFAPDFRRSQAPAWTIPIRERLYRRTAAECNSAIQQSGTLRYFFWLLQFAFSPTLLFSTMASHEAKRAL